MPAHSGVNNFVRWGTLTAPRVTYLQLLVSISIFVIERFYLGPAPIRVQIRDDAISELKGKLLERPRKQACDQSVSDSPTGRPRGQFAEELTNLNFGKLVRLAAQRCRAVEAAKCTA